MSTLAPKNNRKNVPVARICVWFLGLIGLWLILASWRGLYAFPSNYCGTPAAPSAETRVALDAE